MKALVFVTEPPKVVTTTFTAPAEPAGVVTVIDDALLAVTVPALPPKVTELGDARLVPSMVTTVPPAVDPCDGVTEVIVGVRAYVNAESFVPVPLGVVTLTFTVPVPGGEVTVSEVALVTSIEVPGFDAPKSTAVAPVKPVPVTVTEVPPAVGPPEGLTAVTVGGAL